MTDDQMAIPRAGQYAAGGLDEGQERAAVVIASVCEWSGSR